MTQGISTLLCEDDWSTGANTIFSDYCTNTQIDHEHQFCGGFDIYSQGEYITKGRMEFNDYNNESSVSRRNKNSVALIQFPGQTWCTANPWCSFNQAATERRAVLAWLSGWPDKLHHSEFPAMWQRLPTTAMHTTEDGEDIGRLKAITGGFAIARVSPPIENEVIYYDRGETGSNCMGQGELSDHDGASPASTGTRLPG